jgi:uncharacterized membrane protein
MPVPENVRMREKDGMKLRRNSMATAKVDIGGWLGEAWEAYKANFGLLLVSTLVAGLLGALTCGVLFGPMVAGLTLVVLRLLRRQEPAPQVGDVFKGFDFFLQSLLLAVVVGVALGLASLVPVAGQFAGLLLSPLVMFAMALVVDRKMEFWPAIQASYEKAKTDYVSLLVVTLLGGLISGAGALLCGVGVILTAPFGAVLTGVAYCHFFDEPVAQDAPPVIEATIEDAP